MLRLLPEVFCPDTLPTFHDPHSVTMLELAGVLQGKMNEVVSSYNEFASNINKIVSEYVEGEESDFNVFKVAIRQEFQNFIDVIDLKIKSQDKKIEGDYAGFLKEIREKMAAQDNKLSQQDQKLAEAYEFMVTNLTNYAGEIVNGLLHSGELRVGVEYDEGEEELSIIASEGGAGAVLPVVELSTPLLYENGYLATLNETESEPLNSIGNRPFYCILKINAETTGTGDYGVICNHTHGIDASGNAKYIYSGALVMGGKMVPLMIFKEEGVWSAMLVME